jgi:uncharacterized membrane protein
MKEKKRFAQGICFYKLFWIFLLGSIFGAYYEQILNIFIHYHYHHELVWQLRRGVIYGPISPVYGAGAVLFTVLLLRKPKSNFKTFLEGALIGGVFEYGISFLQETFLGTISWDYRDAFLNINGRTTIPYMIVWGLLALLFAKVVYPSLSSLIESFPQKFAVIFTHICLVLLIVDFTVSWGALFRQMLRVRGYAPVTFVGEFFDRYYDDEVLKKYYTNMKLIEVKR